jgi:hypothetical protein
MNIQIVIDQFVVKLILIHYIQIRYIQFWVKSDVIHIVVHQFVHKTSAKKHVKLWIHFIAGDTSGHNNLVGHMNGGRPKFIYWDCRCLFDDLSSPIPMRYFITSEELKQAHLTEDGLKHLHKKTFPMLLRMSLLATSSMDY